MSKKVSWRWANRGWWFFHQGTFVSAPLGELLHVYSLEVGQRGRREKFPKDPAGCLKLLFADLDFCCFLVSLVGESEALRIKGNRGPEWSGEEMKKKLKKKKPRCILLLWSRGWTDCLSVPLSLQQLTVCYQLVKSQCPPKVLKTQLQWSSGAVFLPDIRKVLGSVLLSLQSCLRRTVSGNHRG